MPLENQDHTDSFSRTCFSVTRLPFPGDGDGESEQRKLGLCGFLGEPHSAFWPLFQSEILINTTFHKFRCGGLSVILVTAVTQCFTKVTQGRKGLSGSQLKSQVTVVEKSGCSSLWQQGISSVVRETEQRLPGFSPLPEHYGTVTTRQHTCSW